MTNIESIERLKRELKTLKEKIGENHWWNSEFENWGIESKQDLLIDVFSLIEREKCITLLNTFLKNKRFNDYDDLNKVLFVTKYGKLRHVPNPKNHHGLFELYYNYTEESKDELRKICKNYRIVDNHPHSGSTIAIPIDDLLLIPFSIELYKY